jgi:pimeloyl-ACP methyl ester carboxylesterase
MSAAQIGNEMAHRVSRRSLWAVSLAALLAVAGCAAAPVGVTRADALTVRRQLTANALSGGEPSISSRNALNRLNLADSFEEDPDKALAELRSLALATGENDLYYALAELSFLHAERTESRSWHLAAALYAWSYLFGDGAPDPFDPRLRTASDLYNRALTEGLSTPDDEYVDLRGGTFPLPFGELRIEFDEAALSWHGRHLRDFIPVAELEVHGLRNRFRTPGIGAPLAASAAVDDLDQASDFLPPRLKIPVTAVLVVEEVRKQLAAGTVRARLDLHTDTDPEMLSIAGRHVPLEREQTATIAAMLADSPIWKQELRAFLGKVTFVTLEEGQLVGLRPHQPGRIPVVFVHGTNSSPGRWAEMVNALDNDPRIHDAFEPWFFFYNSGNPIAYSSYLLRKSLTEAASRMDPAGKDPCLRDMVVIGHSQGGLLTKMTVVDTGDRLWRNASNKPFEEVRMTDEQRELVRQIAFVKPLPFVRRVVFIATPHRGSYLVSRDFIRRLVSSLVSVPKRVTDLASGLVTADPTAFTVADLGTMTAIDNMSPRHRFIRTLVEIPIAPGVVAHSIIPVRGSGPIESGNDGVVEYSSAHIEGVESEKVVRSDHSTQGTPETIEEVRRILLEHAAAANCGGAPSAPVASGSQPALPLEGLAKERGQLLVLEQEGVVAVLRLELAGEDVDSIRAQCIDELPRLVGRVEPITRERSDEGLAAAHPAE